MIGLRRSAPFHAFEPSIPGRGARGLPPGEDLDRNGQYEQRCLSAITRLIVVQDPSRRQLPDDSSTYVRHRGPTRPLQPQLPLTTASATPLYAELRLAEDDSQGE
jgi:hypothetical protein